MAKAEAGRSAVEVAMACFELRRDRRAERELLETWARDATIHDIFEDTKQIQPPIVTRARWAGRASSGS